MVGRSAPAGACVLRQSPNDNRRRRSVSTVPARLQPPVPRRARDSVAAAGRSVARPGLRGRSHGEPGTPWPRPGGPWRVRDSMAGPMASPGLRGRSHGEPGTPWPRPDGPRRAWDSVATAGRSVAGTAGRPRPAAVVARRRPGLSADERTRRADAPLPLRVRPRPVPTPPHAQLRGTAA